MGRPGQPDVLLVVADALRAANLGCYGYGRDTSPNIDRLAAGGRVFAHAFAPNPPTEPSFTSMLSGLGAPSHGVFAMMAGARPPSSMDSLPRAMARAGYRTVIVSVLKGWISEQFEITVDSTYTRRIPFAWRKAEYTTTRALTALRELDNDQPLFMLVHYLDSHTPYLPPPPYDRLFYPGEPGREFDPVPNPLGPRLARSPVALYHRAWIGFAADPDWVVAQYDGAIRYLDSWLQVLFDAFQARAGGDGLVVLTADHGEVLLEDDESMFEHIGLRDPVLRIPLIVAGRGVPRDRVDATVVNSQVAHTLIGAAGAAWGDGIGRSGHDLLADRVQGAGVFLATYATRYFELAAHAGDRALVQRLSERGDVRAERLVTANGGTAEGFAARSSEGDLVAPLRAVLEETEQLRSAMTSQRSALAGTEGHRLFEAWRWSKPEGAAVVAARLARLGYEEEGPVVVDAEGNVKNELLRWRDIAEELSPE